MSNPKVDCLIKCARSTHYIAKARKLARSRYGEFPTNGCASFLSCLLELCGIDVTFTTNAEALARQLAARHWRKVPVGQQIPGDVGVTRDENHNGMADHIYVVARTEGADLMQVADNQAADPHPRFASGHGKTPTAYFLRAQG